MLDRSLFRLSWLGPDERRINQVHADPHATAAIPCHPRNVFPPHRKGADRLLARHEVDDAFRKAASGKYKYGTLTVCSVHRHVRQAHNVTKTAPKHDKSHQMPPLLRRCRVVRAKEKRTTHGQVRRGQRPNGLSTRLPKLAFGDVADPRTRRPPPRARTCCDGDVESTEMVNDAKEEDDHVKLLQNCVLYVKC